MGLMRKEVRRATPRPVKQVKRVVRHPARTAVRAATPKPIRNAQRQGFKATHPVNTLENAIIDTVMPRGPSRSGGAGGRGRVSSRPAASRPTGAGAGSPPGRQSAAGRRPGTAARERELLAERIAQFERDLLSRHLIRPPGPASLTVGEVQEPDASGFRAELQQQAGIGELTQRLVPFGTPPTAPPIIPPDLTQTRERLSLLAVQGVSQWHWRERRRLRQDAAEQAVGEVAIRTRQLEHDREMKQQELDATVAQLTQARQAVDGRVDAWVVQQRQEAVVTYERRCVQARAWSERLSACDPTTVREALDSAAVGNQVRVGRAHGPLLDVEVVMSAPADWLPAQEPALTAAGHLTVKKRSATAINTLYASALASEVMRVCKVVFSLVPALRVLRVSVRQSGASDPIFYGRFRRESPAAWNGQATGVKELLAALARAENFQMNNHNRTRELRPIEDTRDRKPKGRRSACGRMA